MVHDYNDTYGENIKIDCLVVIDDVSSLAEKLNEFARFLTVARKLKYSCVYIFHIIYPKKAISKLIFSQTNIFKIFPGSVKQSSI